MIDRPARQRIIVGEEPPQHLSVVKAAIAQHGDRAGQMLYDTPVQEKIRRDAAHHRVTSAHRQQLPVIEQAPHDRDLTPEVLGCVGQGQPLRNDVVQFVHIAQGATSRQLIAQCARVSLPRTGTDAS